LKNRRQEPPQRPTLREETLITDGEGFDGYGFDANGFDKEGFHRDGFNAAGMNRSGQSMSDFPPDFIDKIGQCYDRAVATGKSWVAPITINVKRVRQLYPQWYTDRESAFPEEDQVR
jgi:hypothetical protein